MNPNSRYINIAGVARANGTPESTARRKLNGVQPDAIFVTRSGSISREHPLFLETRIDELRGVIGGNFPLAANAQ